MGAGRKGLGGEREPLLGGLPGGGGAGGGGGGGPDAAGHLGAWLGAGGGGRPWGAPCGAPAAAWGGSVCACPVSRPPGVGGGAKEFHPNQPPACLPPSPHFTSGSSASNPLRHPAYPGLRWDSSHSPGAPGLRKLEADFSPSLPPSLPRIPVITLSALEGARRGARAPRRWSARPRRCTADGTE